MTEFSDICARPLKVGDLISAGLIRGEILRTIDDYAGRGPCIEVKPTVGRGTWIIEPQSCVKVMRAGEVDPVEERLRDEDDALMPGGFN